MNRTPPFVLASVLAVAAACGPVSGKEDAADGAAASPADASRRPDGSADAPWLELGTGGPDFVPLMGGEVVPLYHGAQGSQHVLVSLRVHGMAAGRLEVNLPVRRKRDGIEALPVYRARLPFQAREGGFVELTGLERRIDEPEIVLEGDVILSASVEDGAGRRVDSSLVVGVAWSNTLPGG